MALHVPCSGVLPLLCMYLCVPLLNDEVLGFIEEGGDGSGHAQPLRITHDVAAALSGSAGFVRRKAESRPGWKKEDPESFSPLASLLNLPVWCF